MRWPGRSTPIADRPRVMRQVFGWLAGDDRAIRRSLIGAMAIGFAALVLAGIAAVAITGRVADHTGWVNHTYEVEVAIANLARTNEQAETARRGYLLTGDAAYRRNYRDGARQLDEWIAAVGRLTADNVRQRDNVAAMARVTRQLVAARDASARLVATGRSTEARRLFDAEVGAQRMRQVRQIGAAMADTERKLLLQREGRQRDAMTALYLVIGGAAAVVLFVALVSLFAVLRYTRDLAASRAALQSLNDNLEATVAERTADLSRANEEIQRFAYIVSHDLRSPLVNVMGFTAELDAAADSLRTLIDRAERDAPAIVTPEARFAAREDLPEAIGFIRTSTQKMDRLINAILQLSRQGRRALVAEPLDLATLAQQVGDTLHQQIVAGGIAYVIEPPLPDLVSDRLAVEQIVANLVENAVKYLQPGRPGRVVVRGGTARGRVWIEVADNGRGIDPRDHQRIFDLFRRSGAQDQPGEGIGLAHVRALAYRLGGTIDVASEPGAGATFRLSLPPTLDDARGPDR